MSSPYIATFIDALRSFRHEVSVVLPTTQRSWIGKAHLLPPSIYPFPGQSEPSINETVSDICTPTYYNPEAESVHEYPPKDSDYWVLVPGTPATCTQLGLFHQRELFPHKSYKPFDLVLSGPNHGRNTTAAFAMSSGTLGGALEGAVSGIRAIAISFAFFTKQEGQELVREASLHSMKIVEKLCHGWTLPMQANRSQVQDNQNAEDTSIPDVYTINVPLVEGISHRPIQWTWMLDNKWPNGSLYKVANRNKSQTSEKLSGQVMSPPSFKWAPSFTSIWKVVDESPDGNDGKVIRDGITSITPLKASFEGLFGKGSFTGEFKI